MTSESLAGAWPAILREACKGVSVTADMGQRGLGVPGWSLTLWNPNAVLVRWGKRKPHYPFALAETLNLILGQEDYGRMQHYAPFARGHAMVEGRPWRPLPGEALATGEEILVPLLLGKGDALVTASVEKRDAADSLAMIHAHASNGGLMVTVGFTRLDLWRELPYVALAWAAWASWIACRVGLEADGQADVPLFALTLQASVGYALAKDVPRIQEALAGPAPVGSTFDPLTEAPDWTLVNTLEEQIRRYQNDELGVVIEGTPIMPACWSALLSPLRLCFDPDVSKLPEFWRKVL